MTLSRLTAKTKNVNPLGYTTLYPFLYQLRWNALTWICIFLLSRIFKLYDTFPQMFFHRLFAQQYSRCILLDILTLLRSIFFSFFKRFSTIKFSLLKNINSCWNNIQPNTHDQGSTFFCLFTHVRTVCLHGHRLWTN